ncbi:MAG: hypothetical protein Q7R40_10435 [Phaeospirillum sp.]|nr:hypothetical protein [Phaeospirillum sp.]
MGGFFSPDPPPAPAPIAPIVTADPAIAETQARQDAIDRNRRGLHGTIATSERGVLQPSAAPQKNLLGE